MKKKTQIDALIAVYPIDAKKTRDNSRDPPDPA